MGSKTFTTIFFLAANLLAATVSTEPDFIKEFRQMEGYDVEAVSIDPMGAEGNVPWTVHVETLAIKNRPDREAEEVSVLRQGDQVIGDYFLVSQTDEEWLLVENEGTKGWVSRYGLTRPHPKNLLLIGKFGDLPVGEEIVNRWWGIPLDYEPSDLVSLPEEITPDREGRAYQLRQEAADHLVKLVAAAKDDGHQLKASSPYRSGSVQKPIYLRNIERNGLAQRSSAPPGHSEHQLGTTVDFAGERGRFLRNDDKEYLWLTENAEKFGFRQTYTAANVEKTGYIEEPWHWRYMGVDNNSPDESSS